MRFNGLLDVKSPNFLGGNNVHHVLIIVLLVLILGAVSKTKALPKL
jgi:hypothetical protein